MPPRYGQAPPKAKPRNDAYTGLLAISLVAMLVACTLLFLDWYQYPAELPPPLNLPPVKAQAGAKKAPEKAPDPKKAPEKKPDPKKPDDKKPDDKKPDDKKPAKAP